MLFVSKTDQKTEKYLQVGASWGSLWWRKSVEEKFVVEEVISDQGKTGRL